MKKFLLMLIFIPLLASAQVVQDKPVNGTIDESSYQTGQHRSPYFALYFTAMYPWTNRIYYEGQSGFDWGSQRQQGQNAYDFPLWLSWSNMVSSNYNWMLANDNDGHNDTNSNFQLGTNLLLAPVNFWDGSANHDYSNTVSAVIQHRFWGCIPADIAGGDSGAQARDTACIQLMQFLGGPVIKGLWQPLMMIGGIGWSNDIPVNRLLGFSTGSHPYPAGQLDMAVNEVLEYNGETNVGWIIIDWNTLTANTLQASATSIIRSGNTVTFTCKFNRMAMPYDHLNGTFTNDCMTAFPAAPNLVHAFNWYINVTNGPSGIYVFAIDGQVVETMPSTQFAQNGLNLWTNCNSQFRVQQDQLLYDYLDKMGAAYDTRADTHDAGSAGKNGWFDDINYQSVARGQLQSGNLGTVAYNNIKSVITNEWQFDVKMAIDTVQTNHLGSITFIPTFVGAPAPFLPK